MQRVVLDTNVLISAVISDGRASRVFTQAVQGRFRLVVSLPILDELERKLTQKFRFTPATTRAVLANILQAAQIVSPNVRFIAVPRDPDDNRILECAVAGQADVIVTGDQDLLSLGQFHQIPIVSVRVFSEDLLRLAQPKPPHNESPS